MPPSGGTLPAPGSEILAADEPAAEIDTVLHCVRCGHEIAHGADGMSVDGAHEHLFRNPAGWSFRVGCFRVASGCEVRGDSTDEHTWFPGFRWQLADCGACGSHLGWAFSGPLTSFYGLILTRLTGA